MQVRMQADLTNHCGACGKPCRMMRCGCCQKVFYCNAKCQKDDWKKHKRACVAKAAR
jgi:hypothetical protein